MFRAALVFAGSTLVLGARAEAQVAATGMVCSQPGMACRYWEPVGYDPAKRYPLVLYFHGAGQSGNDNRKQIEDWGSMPQAFLERRAKYPAFFVAPQAPSAEGDDRWVNRDWDKGSYDHTQIPESASMKKALAIVASLRARYSVDPERIYVMGESMGGFGTWDALARHPDLFAAGVPADGGGSPKAAPLLRNTAILASHYETDGAVPSSSDREMYRALAAVGGRPIYIERRGQGHGVAGAFVGHDGYYAWLFAQRRGVPPTAPFPLLALTPAGGKHDGPVTISLAGTEEAKLRWTTNGSPPTATSGMAYARPFTLDVSAIVHAAAFTDDETVFAAAPFQIGAMPLPGGMVIEEPREQPMIDAGTADAGTAPAGPDGGTLPEPPSGTGGAPQPGDDGADAGDEDEDDEDESEDDEPPAPAQGGCSSGGARPPGALVATAWLAFVTLRARSSRRRPSAPRA